ncbi:hypothetical protein MSG28_013866 [Choristoneura fumiferana]|uniref:Uncharacterized protein n=1 Tax=Choristoneura fumiferana TaxID=7141 RepID=A0ACC0K9D3_CHOFU|nr:hypothetical protein MSG28_013866 [Choristoneura fumiferana]
MMKNFLIIFIGLCVTVTAAPQSAVSNHYNYDNDDNDGNFNLNPAKERACLVQVAGKDTVEGVCVDEGTCLMNKTIAIYGDIEPNAELRTSVGRPPTKWTDDLVKAPLILPVDGGRFHPKNGGLVGRPWEAYVEQWTSYGWYDDDNDTGDVESFDLFLQRAILDPICKFFAHFYTCGGLQWCCIDPVANKSTTTEAPLTPTTPPPSIELTTDESTRRFGEPAPSVPRKSKFKNIYASSSSHH